MRIRGFFIVFFSLIAGTAVKGQEITIDSPDGRISASVRVSKDGISYQVAFEKKMLVNWSKLSIITDGNAFAGNLSFRKPAIEDRVEKYDMRTGKASHIEARYREVTLGITQASGTHMRVNLTFRIFNDGVAFRYQFTGRDNASAFTLNDERDEFRLAGNPLAKVLMLPNFTSSHEGFYTTAHISELPEKHLVDMPALFEYDNGSFLAITEAALLDYAGMYLSKEKSVLVSKLSPLPSDTTTKVKGKFPHVSPWRVLMIGNKMGTLIESNILTTLCPPSRLQDESWIKPGKTTFPWWNGNVVPDTLNAPGNNFVTQQYYIDFCHRAGIEYHSVVEYGLHQWYVDDGVGFQPGPHPDVTSAVPGLDMKQVCDYAHTQGVGVRVWVQWAALYPKLDAAFAQFEKWGLSGMMIDFMDRDDQEMVNIQTEMLEKAAKHHLHIQFHGAYKPTGLSRTYPNELTREGTLNYEVHKWGKPLSAGHDLDIAFTRALAGATDYHLGGFRSVPDSLYKTQYTRPLMSATRSHMLAMYVVLENPLGMVCDYPDAYEGQPGFDFLKEVPTTWDETRVLEAKPDEYIVVARRKGKQWFLGSINNNVRREIKIPLRFLNGTYTAKIYQDAKDSRRYPSTLREEEKLVGLADTLSITLEAKGGCVIAFHTK